MNGRVYLMLQNAEWITLFCILESTGYLRWDDRIGGRWRFCLPMINETVEMRKYNENRDIDC